MDEGEASPSAHLFNIDRTERSHAEKELTDKLTRVIAHPQ
jgi:hypothetical protein